MLKNTLIGLSLVGLFSAGVSFAADKATVEPGQGKGPTDAMSEAVPTMKPEIPAPTGPATAQAPAAAATTGTAKVTCTQADLAAMITKAGAMADKDKQRMTLGHLDLAQKSLNQKDMDGCSMHMKEASAGIGTVTK